MERSDMIVLLCIVFILQQTLGKNFELCDKINVSIVSHCESFQIWGSHNTDGAASCDVDIIQPDSSECSDGFSATPVISSSRLGQISLKPFVLHIVNCKVRLTKYTYSHVVPNIVFKGIKWKKLKFRVEQVGSVPPSRHCRRLAISDDMKIDDRAVLHYDCYRSLTDGSYVGGKTHVLDLEATDGTVIDGRQFLFYIPATVTLIPNPNGTIWKPFIYIENLATQMRLHIIPPPAVLNFTYQIEVVKTCDDCAGDVVVENVTVMDRRNDDDEVTFDYTPTTDGWYYMMVKTLHEQCMSGKFECQSVKSPIVTLVPKPNMLIFSFYIIGSLIVVSLLVYLIYRRYCRGPSEIPKPTKVVVIYPTTSSVHSECVASFVTYLRSEFGLDVSYDGDIPTTSHCDPYFWAKDVMREASHIMYIVGPKDKDNYLNSVHQDVDNLLLSFLKATRASKPDVKVINVFFEHSNGPVPNETRNDLAFYLLNDWQKLIAYLSRDLLPMKQIMRTDRGKSFIKNLTRMKKSLTEPSVVLKDVVTS